MTFLTRPRAATDPSPLPPAPGDGVRAAREGAAGPDRQPVAGAGAPPSPTPASRASLGAGGLPAPLPPARAAPPTAPAAALRAGGAAQAPEQAVTLLVCTTCRGPDGADARPTDGERLLAALDALAGGVRVEGTACLGNCNRRLSAALVAGGGWSYVFGGLVPADAADILEGARMLGEAAGAPLPWRGRPECLKRGLVARIPHLAQGGGR